MASIIKGANSKNARKHIAISPRPVSKRITLNVKYELGEYEI